MPSDCAACHPGPSNAVLKPDETRYDGVQAPRCESCHANIASGQDQPGNLYHQMHGAKLSCQVCHSVEYTNCQGCHVDQDNSFVLEGSSLGFLIGRNPQQSYERPYQYVPVRHIPVTTDTFAAFGSGLLDQFGQLETWTYATPHNIQRQTPQTKSCNACHGNPDIFLTADKISPQELEANQDVIVSGPPERITEDTQFP
jgi:thiosulfate/3-mercaptopyruvate sulfurtransferase